MEKITIVINGVGGCGKDTLVEILSGYHKVKNISSITPIKEITKRKNGDTKIIKLCKIIYDYYCGKKITKNKYA